MRLLSSSAKLSHRVLALGTLFVLYLVPVLVFVWLADEVSESEKLPFDRSIMLWLHSLSSPTLTAVFQTLTDIGGALVITPLTLAIAGWYVFHHRYKPAIMVAASVLGAGLINLILKFTFQRTRPDFWTHLVNETSYSFPSGHAMASSALALSLVVLCWRTKWRLTALAGATLYIVFVGISRMYLGVHYPSDILAGWSVSFVWVSIVGGILYGYRRYKIHRNTHEKDTSLTT